MGQWTKWLLGALIISIAIGLLGGLFIYNTLNHTKIVEGVRVNGIDLSGLSQNEAKQRIEAWLQEEEKKEITLAGLGKKWQVRYKDIGFEANPEKLAKEAYLVGRQGNIAQQFLTRRRVAQQSIDIRGPIKLDEENIEDVVTSLTKGLLKPPQNAYFMISPEDAVEIVSGSSGEKIVLEPLIQDIRTAINAGEEPTLELKVEEFPPEQTSEDIEGLGIKAVVSEYSTTFDPKQVDRSYNVHVAASALNGLLIKPGETISFNEIVGPRSSEAGYRKAPVIINNELVPDLGGGVCQVSTTLYNSLLLADFEIVERVNHSIPVSYAPVGRDATVAYGWIDFKFRNNRDTHIYLTSNIVGNRLTFKVFADPKDNKQVEIVNKTEEVIEPKLIKENDPNLEQGTEVVKEEGRKGYKTTTVRIVKENGKVIKREVVTKSYYRPKDRVVAMGTKPVSNTIQIPGTGQTPPQNQNGTGANPNPTPSNPEPPLQPIEQPSLGVN